MRRELVATNCGVCHDNGYWWAWVNSEPATMYSHVHGSPVYKPVLNEYQMPCYNCIAGSVKWDELLRLQYRR